MKYIAKKILSDYKQHCLILLHVKTMETYCVSYKKKILQTKTHVSEKLNKID